MKNLKFLSLILMIFFVASCTKDLLNEPSSQTADDTALLKSSSPKVKIAVMSDVHYMHPSLFPANLEDSPTFLSGLNRDRKIPQMSDPIFRKVVSELIKEKPDIVLISGDMAREGELIDHQTVCGLLQQLENNGIKVYVAPGNNDILNPDAYSYTAEPPFRVPNISVDQYTSMYGNFGYNEALYRDENSLSYICQPCDGLWIMAIDDCKRTVLPDGSAVSKVSGAINPLTLVWIQEKMAEANANGIMVIPMMHYGILEHYTGQKNLEPLIKNAAESIPVLMNAGIRLVLTGHYHANSISSFTENGKTLTDIQTGSLVTPPYPYRMMTLDDNFINIDTRFVTSIDGEVPGGMDFLTYSETTIAVYMIGFFNYYLPKLFGLSPEDATLLAPSFAHAWLAYFAGDEKMSPAERNTINTLVQSKSPSLVTLLNNVWTDLAPKDTKTHIKLK